MSIGYWQTVYVCQKCGAIGQRIPDRQAGRFLMWCPGCRKLMSKTRFKREKRYS
jgi:DNA-directed RNA polymerase subunit RPC12/RpoP